MNSEDTIFEQNQNVNEETMVDNTSQVNNEESKTKSSRTNWKQVAMGGVTGILFGALGVTLMGSASNPENEANEIPEDEPSPVPGATHVTVDDLPVASSVNDNMSFSEAFAAARAEVGAGGVFAWHGGVYGTYYADEWNNMTPEEQADFGNKVHYGMQHTDIAQQSELPIAAEVETVQAEVSYSEDQPGSSHGMEMAQADTEPAADSEVHILGIEQMPMEDGSVIGVAMAEVDGVSAAFIDINNDGVVDGVAMDVNNDGHYSADEIVNAQDQNIHMDQLQQQMDAQNYLASAENSGPDYVNNANVGGYEV